MADLARFGSALPLAYWEMLVIRNHDPRRLRTIQAAFTMRKALRKKAECIKQAMIRVMVLMPCNCAYQSWIPTASQPFTNIQSEVVSWLLHFVRKSPSRCIQTWRHDGRYKPRSSQKYTNHCVRATTITLWSHRNEQSLRSYNARPSSAQI